MPNSLPSKQFVIVDVPEVEQDFRVKFVYNFFAPDETVNDSGILPQQFIKDKAAREFTSDFIDTVNFKRFVPRFNKITWKPVLYGDYSNANITATSIKDNLDKIHSETSFTVEDWTTINLQKLSSKDNFQHYVGAYVATLLANEEGEQDISSPVALSNFLAERLPDDIPVNLLVDALYSPEEKGFVFVGEDDEMIDEPSDLEQAGNMKFNVQFNNKLIGRLMSQGASNLTVIQDQGSRDVVQRAKQIQEKAIKEAASNILEGRSYDLEISEAIDVRAIETDSFDPTTTVVGYLINKTETDTDGKIINHPPIIVESPFAHTTVDLKVKYGSSYEYTIQAIALVQIQAENIEDGQSIALDFLVASRPSNVQFVGCVEEVPPPPPADFKITWDYSKNVPMLSWNFPTNSQRDVKYFQVFRRQVLEEPFVLMKMYDFNDAIEPVGLDETPDPLLVETLETDNPKNFWYDTHFDRANDSYIYAVCAVDAHGISSNYSNQLYVWFDRFKNKMFIQQLSVSDAPKAYPNLFVESDVFVDSIKDSGHKKVTLVFNPEAIKVIDSRNNDLQLLKMREGDKYVLQMINLDLQEQQKIEVVLDDKIK